MLFLAPWVGAVSDASGRHKTWVVGCTLACVAATLAFSPLARANLPTGTGLLLLLAAFALANTAYQLALPPYNAMLPELALPSERGRLSGIGTALGYVGSIAGVLLVGPFVTGGSGLPAGGRQAAFTPTALLFLLFALPFFVFCRDRGGRGASRARVRWGSIAGELASAFRDAGRHRGLRRFVVASYFYQDALGTAISFMALYAVTVLGLPAGGEIRLFVTLTIPAVGGAALAGFACDRWGPRRTLAAVLAAWIAGLVAIALGALARRLLDRGRSRRARVRRDLVRRAAAPADARARRRIGPLLRAARALGAGGGDRGAARLGRDRRRALGAARPRRWRTGWPWSRSP